MERLTRQDIVPTSVYEATRDETRRRIIRTKRDRIVQVGDHMTWHFENRETMRYQVQEMMRAEGLTTEEQIAGELDAYNPIVPGPGELSVTMMIEYETPEERAIALPRFVHIDEHTFLKIGDSEPVPGVFDRGQISADKVSSVQYVKFHLNEKQIALLRQPGTVIRAVVTHPAYRAEAVLGENVRREIAEDPS
jgi:hypothetical protein